MSQVQTIAQPFLMDFYSDSVKEHRFCLWTSHNRSHTWHSDIEVGLKSVNAHTDTYFSMAIFPKGVTKRKKDNASAIFGVWLDVDCGDKGNGKDYFPTVDKALAWVEDALAGKWSYIVHSGSGLHVYLMFDEPFWFDKDGDRERAERVTKGFWSWANEMCPHTIDALWDLSRVMRLPGSHHTGTNMVCHVIDECQTEVAFSDLEEFLPEVTLSESKHVIEVDGEVDVAELKSKLEMLGEVDPLFKKSWERRRRLKDSSPSGYCMSIANHLAIAQFSDGEIISALKIWRDGQTDAKDKGDQWYEATVMKAREENPIDLVGPRVNLAIEAAIEDPTGPSKLMAVSAVFGQEVTSITRRVVPEHKGNKEKVSYLFRFKEGDTLSIPNTETLMSQTRMRAVAVEEKMILLQHLKAPKWDDFIRIVLTEMVDKLEEVEGNLAFNVEQELRRFVIKKRENVQVHEDLGDWEPTCLYEEDEIVYFAWAAFKNHMQSSGYNISNGRLAVLIKGIGCEPKQFNNVDRTRLWSVPEDES